MQQWRTLYNEQKTKRDHSLFTNKFFGHVTTAAGIKVLWSPKKVSQDLVKERSRKSESIQKYSLTKPASSLCHPAALMDSTNYTVSKKCDYIFDDKLN